MGKMKQAVMSAQYDDMGSPMDTIKEIKIINDFIESSGWGQIDLPEGFGGDCSE